MTWWDKKLSQTMFLSSGDDHVVFYPFGPFKGYVLPRPAFQRVALRSAKQAALWMALFTIITTVLGTVLGLGIAAMTGVGIVDCLFYPFLIRRVSRKCVPIPFIIAVRFYARYYDEQRLMESFLGGFLLASICVVGVLLRPDFMLVLGIGFFGSLSLLGGFLLIVRYRETHADRNHERL